MKTLILMRHAKSDWHAGINNDHDRPLNERGKTNAQQMGAYLKQQLQHPPEAIIHSSACRTTQTAELIVLATGWYIDCQADELLYGCSIHTLLNRVQHLDEKHNSVMLINHEPTCSAFIQTITGEHRTCPTAAVAVIQAKHWSNFAPNQATLTAFYTPKKLPAPSFKK